jgi:serine/threonine kinase 16
MGAGSSNLCDDLLGLAPPPEQSFTVQGKQYASVRLLGEGGYAFVFLVRDDATGRMYALKKARVAAAALCARKRALNKAPPSLLQVNVGTRTARAAVLEEVACMQRFKHPSLLPLLASETVVTGSDRRSADADEVPAQHTLLLMPAFTDGSLQDACDDVTHKRGRLPAVVLLHILCQAAEGLACMHAYAPPYAHRDVKPGNLLLTARATTRDAPAQFDGLTQSHTDRAGMAPAPGALYERCVTHTGQT